MGNDIYQTLELWAKLSHSNCQTKDVVNHSLPEEDSNSEQGIEVAAEGARIPGGVVKEV